MQKTHARSRCKAASACAICIPSNLHLALVPGMKDSHLFFCSHIFIRAKAGSPRTSPSSLYLSSFWLCLCGGDKPKSYSLGLFETVSFLGPILKIKLYLLASNSDGIVSQNC